MDRISLNRIPVRRVELEDLPDLFEELAAGAAGPEQVLVGY
jgi:hypothetical protein